ncbi:flagellar hook assembly protein FlgD [Nitrincola iocasae]|jgi:flagellar basal-body rod modification protein FlgD|uniref:Basal-body rod modification protein FlgD n=1 Tax=Nitrincola iocasae TaxID=2614693 RepID=A0A5J6LI13_9GAMM|nr:flagellar hook capping FlgD N-terminal domain-containing protein [Nitrincola iocasae]QEW07751.1 flagellar biosynthesis protein FlgD [Nitrincola iocasae]
MSTINTTPNIFEQINQANQQSSTKKAEGNDDSQMFMKLMIAQLQNQDPTSPADSGEFMQQISSMTMVESMAEMSSTFQTMSNSLLSSQSALQASSMVGQRVFINTDIAQMTQQGGALPGTVNLESNTTDLRVSIYDQGGALVDQVNMGQTQAGERSFVWNASEEVPPGNYQMIAEAYDGEKYTQVDTWLPFTVNSVSLGQNGIGMKVNTAIGSIDFSDVKQLG